VFITAVPNIKLFAWGEGDSGGHVLRETTSPDLCGLVWTAHHAVSVVVCVFITAGPIIKLCAVCGGVGPVKNPVL
jgi:hypothetical protein